MILMDGAGSHSRESQSTLGIVPTGSASPSPVTPFDSRITSTRISHSVPSLQFELHLLHQHGDDTDVVYFPSFIVQPVRPRFCLEWALFVLLHHGLTSVSISGRRESRTYFETTHSSIVARRSSEVMHESLGGDLIPRGRDERDELLEFSRPDVVAESIRRYEEDIVVSVPIIRL